MKKIVLVIALLTAINAHATWDGGNALTQSQGQAAYGAGGDADATGGDAGGSRNNLLMLSTTSAEANSGNVPIVCPVITAKSKAKQFLFGAYSNSEIGTDPAQVNSICVLYHYAKETGSLKAWDAFLEYARKVDKVLEETIEPLTLEPVKE